jgi:hypothetical protein
MSLYDYRVGRFLSVELTDDDFYGVIQCLMRMADSDNLAKLRAAWPSVWEELHARYNAPDGRLPGEEE